ncbi:MAG TPA: class I SAM-dependent RNA methyltransferase [Longilinea sp.]|nr:class I SAM-dependent RNA methyltransferase [Longilinea sp.]
MIELFAVCSPGLEQFTAAELSALGLKPGSIETDPEEGGISFEGGQLEIYRANLHLRTASRILLRFGQFYAAAFSELRKKASRLPWEAYLKVNQPVALRVTCHQSKLYHSGAVAERVAGAIGDRLGQQIELVKFDENSAEPPALILVRIVNNQCTISLDTSGAHLHRRGYRQAVAKAPLRETLAAALLMAAGWDGSSPLLDPFCGSGTLPIEAAMIAQHIAPGRSRRFGFMAWPDFNRGLWKILIDQAEEQKLPVFPIIQASDRDAGAITMAQANADRAGVLKAIDFSHRAVSAIEPPSTPGYMVTNPPYGVRVTSGHDLRDLYNQFGKVLRLHCSGWNAAILCSDSILLGHTGLRFERRYSFNNGGIPVQLACARIPAKNTSISK